MKTEIWLAYKYLTARRKTQLSFTALVSILGVVVGVGSLVIVLGVMSGFDRELREKLLSVNYHIEGLVNSKTERTEILSGLQKFDSGITEAEFFSRAEAVVKREDLTLAVVVQGLGVQPDTLNRYKKYFVGVQSDHPGILIGAELARRLFIHPEDVITLYIIDMKNKIREYQFRVKGIFRIGIYDVDGFFVLMPFSIAGDFFEQARAPLGVGIKMKDIFQADQLKSKLVNSDFFHISSLRTWAEKNKTLFAALKLEKITMFVILSLIILVAAFNIFSTLTVQVVEKTKDIGILKALGIDAAGIAAIFCLQGMILGGIGIFFGISAGLGILLALQQYRFIRLPAEVYSLEYLPAAINLGDIFGIAFSAAVLCFVFSLIPALRAANIVEAEALRYE